MNGAERIAAAFESARAEGRRAALMPYMMAGYPDLETSTRIARAYLDGGADMIELGIPFSDPLADGPVIHAAAVAALAAGAGVASALAVAREVSGELPVIAMCYANPVLMRGFERFAAMLVDVGVAGLIVPDLPLEEAPAALAALDARGLALVGLIAPTTPTERMRAIGERSRGFVYAVSVTGTTGERSAGEATGLREVLARGRASTAVPLAAGFGIATPAQAASAAREGADGVIVGSRLVRAAGGDGDAVAEVRELVRSFADALAESDGVRDGALG